MAQQQVFIMTRVIITPDSLKTDLCDRKLRKTQVND